MISQMLIEKFNEAADLARAGKHEQALAIYDSLAKDKSSSQEDRAVTGEFLGVVELRRAFCLMDLNHFEQARNVLESKNMQLFIPQFELSTMYDYFFCYGNVLGNLGEIELMDDRLSRGLGIAAEHLGDMQKCENCWYFILYWAKKHEKWAFLEEQCVGAHMFGSENGSVYLQMKALEFGCYAYHGLGKVEKAKKGVEVVISRLKEAGNNEAVINEWEEFLSKIAA